MPRYVVERTFPEGLHIPIDNAGAELCRGIVERNADDGVTWISSFVSDDRTRTFCIYDATTLEAIPQCGCSQPGPRRPDHPGDGARPVLLHG